MPALTTAAIGRHLALVAVALTALACSKSGDNGTKTAPSTKGKPAPLSCADQSEELATWAEAFQRDGVAPPFYAKYRGWWTKDSVAEAVGAPGLPIQRTQLTTIKYMMDTIGDSQDEQRALVLNFREDHMGALDAQYDMTMEVLYDRLEQEEKLFRQAMEQLKDQKVTRIEVSLAFDPEAPWWSVVALTELFHHFDYRKIHFIFRAPPAAKVPALNQRFNKLEGWKHEYGAAAWSDNLPDLITSECPAARDLFATLKPLIDELQGFKEPPLMKQPEVLTKMAEAVRSCDCQVNMDEIKLMLASLAARGEGLLLRTAVLTLADGDKDAGKDDAQAAPVTTITAERDAPWKDTYQQIVEHARKHPDQPVSLRLSQGQTRTADFLARQPARKAAEKKALEEIMK